MNRLWGSVAVCALSVGASGAMAGSEIGPASNIIVGSARGAVDRGAAPQASNNCFSATQITGLGLFDLDFAGTTTDGPAHAPCAFFGSTQIWRDVWYLWTSVTSGPVTITTCGYTQTDTKIAVYSPAAPCSAGDEFVIACNDDFCGTQTSVTFLAQAGQQYRVRIGKYGQTEPPTGGTGLLEISASTVDICDAEGGPCQQPDYTEPAWASNLTFRVADDVVLNASGEATGLCWSGSYFAETPDASEDEFVLTYWSDASGRPGAPIASFRQNVNMTVQRAYSGFSDIANSPNYWYSTTHAPVALQKGVRYWVEVRNYFSGWFWQASTPGDGALQDQSPNANWTDSVAVNNMTFCVDFRSGCDLDTNGDGQISFGDLNNIVSSFNTSCP